MDSVPADLNQPSTLDLGFDVTDEQLAQVKPELEPGERLLWVGWSAPRRSLLGGWWKGLLFTISLWIISGLTLGASSLVEFHPVEPLCLGIGMIALSVGILCFAGTISAAVDHWNSGQRTRGMLYALTDRRAILRVPRKQSSGLVVCSLSGVSMQGMHRVEYPDGSGDLIFQPRENPHWFHADLPRPVGFLGIPHVRQVESLARPVLLAPDSQAGIRSNPREIYS